MPNIVGTPRDCRSAIPSAHCAASFVRSCEPSEDRGAYGTSQDAAPDDGLLMPFAERIASHPPTRNAPRALVAGIHMDFQRRLLRQPPR